VLAKNYSTACTAVTSASKAACSAVETHSTDHGQQTNFVLVLTVARVVGPTGQYLLMNGYGLQPDCMHNIMLIRSAVLVQVLQDLLQVLP